MKSGRHPRRGVLLLVVLSMLVLFTLIAVTFVLVAGQFRRGMSVQPQMERFAPDYRDQLDDGLYQVLRGSSNSLSVIGPHGLLEDLYGNDGLSSTTLGIQIAGAQVPNSNAQFAQLIDLTLSAKLPVPSLYGPSSLYSTVGGAINGYFNGLVFTVTSGPLAGHSTRIVGYNYGDGVGGINQATLRVVALDSENPASVNTQLTGASFLINGRPFNGTGFGYNQADGLIDAVDTSGYLVALLPNPKYLGLGTTTPSTYGTDPAGQGGADEDYDIPDFQNMHLASEQTNPTSSSMILPSFHRPDLISFWINKLGASPPPATLGQIMRQSMLRPFGGTPTADHPNFTGSNPSFDPVAGPWDVDNTGDGVPDSVWLDLGAGVRTAPDGRLYKPLYAIMCLDMDGRLNVNSAGNISDVETASGSATFSQPVQGYFAGGGGALQPLTTPGLALGSGYGPAEITLQGLFPQASAVGNYDTFLAGINTATNIVESRYGEVQLAANTQYAAATAPSGSTQPYPGVTASGGSEIAASALGAIKHFEFPPPGAPTTKSAFGSVPDLWGQTGVALDLWGTPLTPRGGQNSSTTNPWATSQYDTLNNPYVLNLGRNQIRGSLAHNAVDNPFTPAELERVLRQYDFDASSLPSRLAQLLDQSGSNTYLPTQRSQVTTDSSDVPTFNAGLTADLRLQMQSAGLTPPLSLHAADVLTARLLVGGVTAANIPAQLQLMLPPDVMSGLKFDINRPFGNGIDDDSNGVVDDYAEYASGETAWVGAASASGVNLAIDWNGDGSVNAADALYQRHLMARYLYVMAMMVADSQLLVGLPGGKPLNYDTTPASTGTTVTNQTAYALAQWAINAVDFRDRDSIMTPFEFDLNPFNGWSVDGVLGTADDSGGERGLVWGCERPELLITETIAYHDRRTEDLATPSGKTSDPNNAGQTDTMGSPNPTYDQRLMPHGRFFVELYNPWNTQYSLSTAPYAPSAAEAAGEFYGAGVPQGIALNKLDSATSTSPVWRLIVVQPTTTPPNAPADPDDPQQANRPTIERSVYFVAPGGAFSAADGTRYYPSNTIAGNIAPLRPGRFAVVGSAGDAPTPAAPYTNSLGRTSTATDGNPGAVVQITLTPSTNPDANQVSIANNGQTPAEPAPIGSAGGPVQPAIAIPIDTPRSLSVSEPVGGYPQGGFDPTAAGGEGAYTNPIDKPLDITNDATLMINGTKFGYRIVHLQRLANPLAAYDANTNPYLTVDSASVDVTAFNGVDSSGNQEPGAGSSFSKFASTQRGDQMNAATKPAALTSAPGQLNLLWLHEQGHVAADPIAQTIAGDGPATNLFKYLMHHSLGYLNQPYGQPLAGSAPTAAYQNAPPVANGPFPWLTWNNRPYANPIELALVPKSRSSRLLIDYSVTQAGSPLPAQLYNTAGATAPLFGHLLNFFDAGTATGSPPYLNSDGSSSANLYRLFDYVQTPSRFVGTEMLLSPTAYTGGWPVGSSGDITAGTPPGRGFGNFVRPPFNKVSNQRDPGRVNINTVVDYNTTSSASAVWNGVLGVVPGGPIADGYNGPIYNSVALSRQGTSAPSGTYPSQFTNPFRSAAGAALTNSIFSHSSMSSPIAPPRRDIDATLLRPFQTNSGLSPTSALFDYPPPDMGKTYPLYSDPSRSPAFRLQNLSRVANSLTTHSNVYAVWVTVGYFQVTPMPVSTIYPDGYQLGAELGIETGEVKRHRAFYLIDRTIPVGFQRGENVNVDNTVLLRRFIE